MDQTEVISSSCPVQPQTDAGFLQSDDLKRLTDFFSILIKIDKRIKSKKGKLNEKL